MTMMKRMLVFFAALSASASSPLLYIEGYGVGLCSGNSTRFELAINVEIDDYAMSDFSSSFSDCSNDEYLCMDAPFRISVPRTGRPAPGQSWQVDGAEFTYTENDESFWIVADQPARDIFESREVTTHFSTSGDLVKVEHEYEHGAVHVQRVCYGRLNFADLLDVVGTQAADVRQID